jgi:septum site-determining protein MinC
MIEKKNNNKSIEFKGGMFTLPILHLLSNNINEVTQQLSSTLKQAPDFFKQAPVIIDLSSVSNKSLDLHTLTWILRENDVYPVAVKNGSEEQHQIANGLRMAVMQGSKENYKPITENKKKNHHNFDISQTVSAEKRSPLNAHNNVSSETKVISKPVRSGEKVCSEQGDLVILASVSSGAELSAKGNIHVYGSLRGRAMAGMDGDQQARIFCLGLEAELVSVAGHSIIPETFTDNIRGGPAQMYLNNNRLYLSPL